MDPEISDLPQMEKISCSKEKVSRTTKSKFTLKFKENSRN